MHVHDYLLIWPVWIVDILDPKMCIKSRYFGVGFSKNFNFWGGHIPLRYPPRRTSATLEPLPKTLTGRLWFELCRYSES